MSDVLLIFPPLEEKSSKIGGNFPPLNLIFLAAPLEQAGYGVKLIDCRLTRDYVEQIKAGLQHKPLLAGITCMTGYQIISALQISQLIRKIDPQLPIVWGGVHPSLLPHQTIKHPAIDIIVRNEGEITLVELAKTLQAGGSLKGLPGIFYKENGQVIENPMREWVDMETLPMPAWHLIKDNIQNYTQGGVLRVHSSRGCPHKCSFCYNKGYNKGHLSAKAGKKICDEIEFLSKEFNLRKFHFVDDNFLSNRKRAIDFCRALKEKGLNINWGFSIRIDYIKEALISALAEAGVNDCFIGVESGSQRILDKINKGIKLEQIKAANRLLKKYNIMGRYSFMVGFPFEEYEDVVQTIQLAVGLYDENPNTEFNFNNYTPYPGTELYDLTKELPTFKEPGSLEEWGKLYWSNPDSSRQTTDYTFEDVHLMWALNFTRLDKFSAISRPLLKPLKSWAHYRLKKGYLKHTPEFHLLKLAGKIFSPF